MPQGDDDVDVRTPPGRADDASLHPLFLKLRDRCVLVVGAGAVAERKIRTLLESGASVRVVSPEAMEGVRQLALQGNVEWRARAFEDADMDGAWLAFAATSDADTQRRVAAASEARRVFCVAVDDPANASAYSGAVVRRPPFVVAISSSGQAPALTRLVREIIEHVLPDEDVVEAANRLRARWIRRGETKWASGSTICSRSSGEGAPDPSDRGAQSPPLGCGRTAGSRAACAPRHRWAHHASRRRGGLAAGLPGRTG